MRPVPPRQLAQFLRRVADQLDQHGDRAIAQATVLAARGYPTSTLGTGARSSVEATSTERAALDPGPWAGIDDQLARDTRRLWRAGLDLEATLGRILAHASDDDPTPAGRGACMCGCGRVCKPPRSRLKAGLAPACYEAWRRWRADCAEAGHDVTISDFRRARARERVSIA